MNLPTFPQVSSDTLQMIAEHHGLAVRTFKPLPSIGVFNAIYLLGDDLVLRVPRDHPHFVAALTKEAIAVPAARAAGVRTPRLTAFDDSRTLLPVPYAVYERVHGAALESLGLDPVTTPAVYRELGRDLARLHVGVRSDSPTANSEHPTFRWVIPDHSRRNLPPQAISRSPRHAGWNSGLTACRRS